MQTCKPVIYNYSMCVTLNFINWNTAIQDQLFPDSNPATYNYDFTYDKITITPECKVLCIENEDSHATVLNIKKKYRLEHCICTI